MKHLFNRKFLDNFTKMTTSFAYYSFAEIYAIPTFLYTDF